MATTKKKKPTVPADFYVGFSGATPQVNVEEPKLGEQVEYTVLGTVRHTGESIRDDGETRLGVRIEVEAAWPKGTKRPENANQSLMFDHDGKATPEAAGAEDSADEGDEIMAKRAEDKAAAEGAGYSDDDKIDPETGEPWEYVDGEPPLDADGNPVRGDG